MSDESTQEGERRNRAFVATLGHDGAFASVAIEQAFLDNPRHIFLPGRSLGDVYVDEALATHKLAGSNEWISSSSQPSLMAAMLEQLDVAPGMRVLEIGAGTGYNAALLASLVGPSGRVVSVDVSRRVALEARRNLAAAKTKNAAVICADGWRGWRPAAPYDRIIAAASAYDIAPAWFTQLRDAGRIVAPWGSPLSFQVSAAFEKRGRTLIMVDARPCSFMRLRGMDAVRRETARDAADDAPDTTPPAAQLKAPSDPVQDWRRLAFYFGLYLWPDGVLASNSQVPELLIGSLRKHGTELAPRYKLTLDGLWRAAGGASDHELDRASALLARWYELGQPAPSALRMVAAPRRLPPPAGPGDLIERTWFRYRVRWIDNEQRRPY